MFEVEDLKFTVLRDGGINVSYDISDGKTSYVRSTDFASTITPQEVDESIQHEVSMINRSSICCDELRAFFSIRLLGVNDKKQRTKKKDN